MHTPSSLPSPSSLPRRARLLLCLVAAALLTLTAACSQSGGSSAAPTTVPATVSLLTAKGPPGTYLTDSSGRALYMWDADRHGKSTCYGPCATAWPPLTISGKATAGPGVNPALIGSTTRKDGTHQVTYGGWPLYYYASDTKPGELSGQASAGFGAVWWVISPDGKPLPSEPVTSTG